MTVQATPAVVQLRQRLLQMRQFAQGCATEGPEQRVNPRALLYYLAPISQQAVKVLGGSRKVPKPFWQMMKRLSEAAKAGRMEGLLMVQNGLNSLLRELQ